MRAKDLVKGNIAYHDTLNPEVWKGDELRVDVRYKLLEIAKRFIEYLEVPDFKLEDVILRGSLVNYNYTQYSDFDLHIVTDFSTLDCDITEQFYLAKKRIWNDEHDITIKGHEVELYVEDVDAKNVSEGTYSVLDARWLRIPEYRQPTIDDRAVGAKARDLMTQINRAIKQGSVEDITRLQDKIKTMRQAGLDAGGEFSTENLAFKIVRNKGYLDKLYKNKNSKFDQELSLDESQAQLDPEVEEFLDGLTPDDVGYDLVGDYIVHYEGFTDQCQDSEEYQDDPEAVFNDVWSDFKRRMGGKDPINFGIVGEHDYPIVYSVFRK
jgi:DNA-binding transcriptional regulator YhcF (GntR family)